MWLHVLQACSMKLHLMLLCNPFRLIYILCLHVSGIFQQCSLKLKQYLACYLAIDLRACSLHWSVLTDAWLLHNSIKSKRVGHAQPEVVKF